MSDHRSGNGRLLAINNYFYRRGGAQPPHPLAELLPQVLDPLRRGRCKPARPRGE